MSYRLRLSTGAKRELERLHGDIHKRLVVAIDGLAENPRPPGCRKIIGTIDNWRIRVGDYRIIYSIDDMEQQLLIFKIRHRRDVYEY